MSLTAALNAATVLGLGVDGADTAIVGRQLATIGSEIPNQLQAASDAVARLEEILGNIASGSDRRAASDLELLRDARAGLDNVLELAKNMRGGR